MLQAAAPTYAAEAGALGSGETWGIDINAAPRSARITRPLMVFTGTLLAVAGCSSFSGESTAGASSSATRSVASSAASGAEQAPSATTGSATGSATIATEVPTSTATPDGSSASAGAQGAPLASRQGSARDVAIRIDVLSLRRSGSVATLNFSVTNTSPAVSPSAPGGAKPKRLQIAQIFAADNQRGITANTWSVNGVFLIDGVHAKKYLVAQDAQGNCACSSSLISTYADVGQPVLLSATFAAPPADVTSVDVYVPNAGTFAGVPIS